MDQGRGQVSTRYEPSWWKEWKQQEEQRACWVVDAIDEDWHSDNRVISDLLGLVKVIQPEVRKRLSLILFCRKNEEPKEFRKTLERLYSPKEIVRLELMPPDENEAVKIAGSPEKLEIVRTLITNNNLKTVGGYPVVIQQLAKHGPEDKISDKGVWREVLAERLCGGQRERDDEQLLPDPMFRFEAAKRAAAVLLVAKLPGLDEGSGESASSAALSSLFSIDVPNHNQLRKAAYGLRNTDLLTQTATGYRFSERHVQEWFTAYALEKVSLLRLKPLLSRHDDEPFIHLQGVMLILSEISEQEGVRDWIMSIHGGLLPPSDTMPWELKDAVDRLDHLQELASKSPYGLSFWEISGLEHLNISGIGEVLAKRLAVPKYTSHEKILLFDVVEAVNAAEALPVAVQIIQNANEDDRVRSIASYTLLRLGSRDHFEDLTTFVKKVKPTTREQSVVVGNIIRGLIKHSIWGFREAYLNLPPSDHGVADASSVVKVLLKKSMTVEDARLFLNDYDWEHQVHQAQRNDPSMSVDHKYEGLFSFAFYAVELLLGRDRLDRNDWTLLQNVVLAKDEGLLLDTLVADIIQKAATGTETRRMLFEAGFKSDPAAHRIWGWKWRWVLTIDDADWLANLAEKHGEESPWLWDDLLNMAHGTGVDSTVAEQIRARVHQGNPELLAGFDCRREEAIKEYQKDQAKRKERRREYEKNQITLKEAVQGILNDENMTLIKQLHNLSWLCFSEDRFSPNNVIGRFEDLAQETQSKVVEICCTALRESKPTVIPDGNSYPSELVHEGEAFATVLRRGFKNELNSQEISKWLPAALVFSIPDNSDTLKHCFKADRVATEDVLIVTICREIRSDKSGGYTAWNLPVEYWSNRLIGKAIEVAVDEALPLSGRSSLLRVVGVRSPQSAHPVARQWLGIAGGTSADDRIMRSAAVDVLLHSDPEAGMKHLSLAINDFDNDLLKEIGALDDRPRGDRTDFTTWPASALESLTRVLHSVLPVDTDPEEELGQLRWVGAIDEMRRLRGRVPSILFERGQTEDLASLERLSNEFPSVRDWFDTARANRDAGELMHGAPQTQEAVPWEKVVQVLDNDRFRLIRNCNDLQAVLIEEILEIKNTVKKHLEMLYQSRAARPKRQNKNATTPRKHQHEDALQAYFHCRLFDCLPIRLPKTDVFLNRETQEASRKRFDIKVQAPTISGIAATVVIEIKWSDHGEVSTSLRDQLGIDYLLANGLTHGIYLVGWSIPGKWSGKAGVDPPDNLESPEAWKAALQRQAHAFRSEHPEIHIKPIVIDLCWDIVGATSCQDT